MRFPCSLAQLAFERLVRPCADGGLLAFGVPNRSRGADDEPRARSGHIQRLIADKGYDCDHLPHRLCALEIRPIIPADRNRKGLRRVATRRDKPASNLQSPGAIATIVAFRV